MKVLGLSVRQPGNLRYRASLDGEHYRFFLTGEPDSSESPSRPTMPGRWHPGGCWSRVICCSSLPTRFRPRGVSLAPILGLRT